VNAPILQTSNDSGQPRLVVIGDYNIDVIVGEVENLPKIGYDSASSDYSIEPGGSAAIVALGLSKIGWETTLFANIGNDLFGRYLLETASESSLHLVNGAAAGSGSTGLSVAFSQDGDRGFISVPNPESQWDCLDALLDDVPTHIHVSYHPYLPGLTEKLEQIIQPLRRAGATVSLDPVGPGPSPKSPMDVLERLGPVDFLMINFQEAKDFQLSYPFPVGHFKTIAQTNIIKRGERGVSCYQPDFEVEVPVRKVNAIETTGAGDNFAVGFITSWLKTNDLKKALLAGNLFGSESTLYRGGIRVQDDYAELVASDEDLFR